MILQSQTGRTGRKVRLFLRHREDYYKQWRKTMLKACSYCGRVHDSRHVCPAKQTATRRYPKDTQASLTRSSSRWQKTRDYIKRRDHGVCQLCLIEYPENKTGAALRPFETDDLSVHHIIKLEDDINKAFDEDNLITLCRRHHELADNGAISLSLLQDIAKQNGERYRDT